MSDGAAYLYVLNNSARATVDAFEKNYIVKKPQRISS